MSLKVTIVVGDGYIPHLLERMKKLGITPAELAREMDKTEQELSRWFSGRVAAPGMNNVEKIERALVNIRRRNARRATPAKSKAER